MFCGAGRRLIQFAYGDIAENIWPTELYMCATSVELSLKHNQNIKGESRSLRASFWKCPKKGGKSFKVERHRICS